MLYLTVLLGFLFFAAVAMTVNEGLWNNAIAFFCITLGGLIGIFGGVPFGAWILGQAKKPDALAWYFVFAGVWGVFSLSVLVLRLATGAASGVRVRFHTLLDQIAGPLMGIMVAVMLTSFAAYTLLHIPIKAGEWDLGGAAGWQQKTFQVAQAPFYNVVKSFAKAERADNEFLGN